MINKYIDNSTQVSYLDEIVKNNDIKCLLNYKNNGDMISYENDGLINLKDNLSGIIDVNNFIDLLQKIAEKLQNLHMYMIFEENLYLNLTDIFIDTNNNIFFMISLEVQKNDLKTLYQEVLKNVCFKIEDNCKHIIEVNNYFNTENYSVNGILKLLQNKCKDKDFNLKINSEEIDKNNINEFINEKKEEKKSFFTNWFSKKDAPIVKENDLDNIFKM